MEQPTRSPLNGRVAVVTGATGTIGSAITNHLHEDGAKVAMLGRRGRRLERLKKRCGDDEKLLPIRTDVVDPFDLVEARDEIHDTFGRVNLVVVTAGIMSSAPFEEAIPAKWNAMIDINARGLLQTAQTFSHDLLAAAADGEPADLVMMGSVGARHRQRHFAVYSAVYALVAQLSRHLRTELGARGVRVHMISPYYAHTHLGSDMGEQESDWEFEPEETETTSPSRVANLVAKTCALPRHINLAEAVIRPTVIN